MGGVDRVISVGPADIARDFALTHRSLLQAPKGNGYWLWKPYFIHRTLLELPENEWLFYCDAGSYFVSSIRPLLAVAASSGDDLMTFADAHTEVKFTKRDVFVALGADTAAHRNTPQRLGGFSLWKNTPQARSFATEWLHHCTDPQLLTDSPSTGNLPDYPAFSAHRHDQSIFSLLAKKHDLPPYRDPSQWGNDRMEVYPNSPYPQLIELTRQRDIPLKTQLKRSLKGLLGLPNKSAERD